MGTWTFSPALNSVGLTSTTSNNNVTIKISNKATALDNAGETIVATFKDDDGCTKSTEFTLKKCSIIPTDPCEIEPLDSAIPWNASNAVVVAHTNSEANWTRFDYVSGDSDFAHPSYAHGSTEITATITQNEDSRQRTATYNAINEEDGCTKQFDVKQAGKSSPGGCTELTTQCDTYIKFKLQDKETTISTYGINSLCTFYLKKNGQDIPITFFKYNALDNGTCNKFKFDPHPYPDNVELINLQYFYNKTVQDLIDYQNNELGGEELFFLKGSTTSQRHNDNTNVSDKLHSFLTGNTLDILNNCIGLEFSTTTPPVFYAFYGDYGSGVGTHDIFVADNFESGIRFENGEDGNSKMFYINFKRNNADLTKFYNC